MKIKKQSIMKIDISLINKTENIRKQYDDIEPLARSIELDGQLQPIGVELQEDGTYNLLYGFRRYHAFQFLLEEGKDYNQIEAKITNGDRVITQLVENIQRKKLTAEEFEDALQSLIDRGLTQTEIAKRLNILLSRVSDSLAAKKVRDGLKSNGVDTSEMSTSTMSAMRTVPKEKRKKVAEKSKKKGGTVRATKAVIEKEIKNNPDHCTKDEHCKKQNCKICSFNIENLKITESERDVVDKHVKIITPVKNPQKLLNKLKIRFQDDPAMYFGYDFYNYIIEGEQNE